MKKIFNLLALILTLTTSAQAPQGFNYQATVRNNSGTLMINKTVTFKFNVIKDTPTSVPVFTETHYVTTDDLGQVSLIVGKGTPTTGKLVSIDWATGTYYLGIELNTGNGFVAMGTTQLLSVPYALYAQNSGSSAIPNLASVLAKNNSANKTKIIDLADPVNMHDAATKGYVDTKSKSFSNFNGFDNYQTWQDDSTVNLVPNSFYFINANNTTLVFPSKPANCCFGDVIYVYMMQNENNRRTVTLKPNGFPVAFSQTDNSLKSSSVSTPQFIGTFNSGLNTIINVGDFWMCGTFTNSSTLTIPTLTTTEVSSMSLNTPNFGGVSLRTGGNITDNGGSVLTSKGMVWSTTQNPTLSSSNKITDGTEIGIFQSYLSNLAPSTTYYLRAFASNSVGTAYGNEIRFVTPAISIPTVTTTQPTNVTYNSQTSGGRITSNGGADVTARGICWCICPQPTINDFHTTDGIGSGSYTSNLANLPSNADVYLRAYATNSAGTAYGDILFSPTKQAPPKVGQSYQGGIVAYIFQAGDSGYKAGETHGIIAAPTDQSSGIQWYNGAYTYTSATKPYLGGANNMTEMIVSSQGIGNYAAKLCADLVLNGYDDWYLPTQEDLIKLYLNRDTIGGFSASTYWSSTQLPTTYSDNCCAFVRTFIANPNDTEGLGDKSKPYKVRAIRYF